MGVWTKQEYKSVPSGTYYDPFGGGPATAGAPYHFRSFNGWKLSHGNARRNGRYVTSDAFFISKGTTEVIPSGVVTAAWNDSVLYRGRFILTDHLSAPWHPDAETYFYYRAPQMGEIEALSATAYAKMRPDLPDFSLLTSAIELKELPQLLKDSLSALSSKIAARWASTRPNKLMNKAGEWHLALQFGWLPLLSDIRSYVDTQKNMQKRVSQLIRDAGRPIKRKTKLDNGSDDTNYQTTWEYGNGACLSMGPGMVSYCYASNRAHMSTRANFTKRTWASCTFQYMLPPGPHDVAWTNRIMRRIMGEYVTPSQVYNIIPWTWLADYFTTLGDFMEAVSPGVADNLTASGLAIMRTITHYKYSEATQYIWGGASIGVQEAYASYSSSTIVKMRMGGSPFGFGFKDGDLSLKQVGILGALGLSKLPPRSTLL